MATRTNNRAAQAAALIRKELKAAFPKIKFSVKSDNFAGGDSITISYTDGVIKKEIEKITDKYKMGNFNAMTDCYEYSNKIADIPRVSFLSIERKPSPAAKNELAKKLTHYNDCTVGEKFNALYRLFAETSFI